MSTSYNFNILPNSALSASGRIRIYFPVQIKIDDRGSPTNLVDTTSALSANINSIFKIYVSSNVLYVSELFSGSYAGAKDGSEAISFKIAGITNPPTTEITGKFNFTTIYDTEGFLVDTSLIGDFTTTPRTLPGSGVSITPASYVVGDITSYIFEFTNENPIPNNAIIKVLIPAQITVVNPDDNGFSVETELTMNPDANCAIDG